MIERVVIEYSQLQLKNCVPNNLACPSHWSIHARSLRKILLPILKPPLHSLSLNLSSFNLESFHSSSILTISTNEKGSKIPLHHSSCYIQKYQVMTSCFASSLNLSPCYPRIINNTDSFIYKTSVL